ncbi:MULTISPECIES: hypothetical protein [Microbacterium]|uniref:hypothetical protein n=1 Tax=Microbacterium TaxID=33882 RepID=UPI0013DE7704|nr:MULTISPECIES: hypothetical protein [Microbacterium]
MGSALRHGSTLGGRPPAPVALSGHRFALDDIQDAYDTFSRAAETKALKVVLKA